VQSNKVLVIAKMKDMKYNLKVYVACINSQQYSQYGFAAYFCQWHFSLFCRQKLSVNPFIPALQRHIHWLQNFVKILDCPITDNNEQGTRNQELRTLNGYRESRDPCSIKSFNPCRNCGALAGRPNNSGPSICRMRLIFAGRNTPCF